MPAQGMPPRVVVFEDEQTSRLFPITIARPAYAIQCGGMRLLDWLTQLTPRLQAVVRPHLQELQQLDYPELSTDHKLDPPRLLVNARLVPSRDMFQTLRHLLREGRPGIVKTGGELAAAVLPETLTRPIPLDIHLLAQYLRGPELTELPELQLDLPLFHFPHDVVRYNLTIFRGNLEQRLQRESRFREVADGLFVAEGVQLGAHLVTDTRSGPILVDEGASIGPFCYLRGPVVLGPRSKVIEHAAIKDFVSVGSTVKIGGEVEAAIIEAYTNKQHHGFLGHSYLGSWINLGAGTCNSDLKNTYGEVKMEYRGEKVSTGMQFLGCIVGDYAKSAINTGIFTGKVIGACSMMYGFITTNVPSFVSFARLFGQVSEMPPDVMIATQQRMFARRNVTQRPCDMQMIRDMFEITREERQQASEPMSF